MRKTKPIERRFSRYDYQNHQLPRGEHKKKLSHAPSSSPSPSLAAEVVDHCNIDAVHDDGRMYSLNDYQHHRLHKELKRNLGHAPSPSPPPSLAAEVAHDCNIHAVHDDGCTHSLNDHQHQRLHMEHKRKLRHAPLSSFPSSSAAEAVDDCNIDAVHDNGRMYSVNDHQQQLPHKEQKRMMHGPRPSHSTAAPAANHHHFPVRERKRMPVPTPSHSTLLPATAGALQLSSVHNVVKHGGLDLAVAEIEHLLGYSFQDPTLLHEALTHSSFATDQKCPSYQRLEYVGDAVLALAITNFLFLTNPNLGPGPLSSIRASNISTEKLARIAVRHRFYSYLRCNSPVLDKMVDDFIESVKLEEEEDLGCIPYGGNGVKAPKVLADIVESIAAAVYVDCKFDLEMFWKVFRGLLEPIITSETVDEQPVTMLYQICQKHGKNLNFMPKKQDGLVITDVVIDGETVGTGSHEQYKTSRLRAARIALQKVSTELEPQWASSLEDENSGSKHKLNEFCSKQHWSKPIYKVEKEEGPSHCKRFICSVEVETSKDGPFIILGDEKARVKDAENAAAAKMLNDILLRL